MPWVPPVRHDHSGCLDWHSSSGGSAGRIQATFDLPSGCRSVIFAWTTLAYVAVFPGGLVWFDWIILGLAVLIDVGTYVGGGQANRRRYA
jgi:hypothetical protein